MTRRRKRQENYTIYFSNLEISVFFRMVGKFDVVSCGFGTASRLSREDPSSFTPFHSFIHFSFIHSFIHTFIYLSIQPEKVMYIINGAVLTLSIKMNKGRKRATSTYH